jgi:hypothetical protein
VISAQTQVTAKPAPAKTPVKTQVKAPATATPVTAQAQGPIQGVPAGAVKIDDNTYRFQEKDPSGKPGKVYLFRRNPFGVSKVEEQQAANIGKALPAPETPATVTDLGDSKIWTKKKTELTPEERSIAEKHGISAASASTQKAVN